MGMQDAFRDAELCAVAIDEALSGARPYGEDAYEILGGVHQREERAPVLPAHEVEDGHGRLERRVPGARTLPGQRGVDAAVDELRTARIFYEAMRASEYLAGTPLGAIAVWAAGRRDTPRSAVPQADRCSPAPRRRTRTWGRSSDPHSCPVRRLRGRPSRSRRGPEHLRSRRRICRRAARATPLLSGDRQLGRVAAEQFVAEQHVREPCEVLDRRVAAPGEAPR